MRTELCRFCLRSGILCSKCKKKIEKGDVSQLDFEITRLLVSLETKYPVLQDLRFYKSFEAKGVLALLVKKGQIAKMLSHGGKIIKHLEKKTKKIIRVLEYNSDERKFLEDLFAPLEILTINKIWLPDGTTETRVIIRRRRASVDLDSAKEIAKNVRGMTLRLEFTS